MEKKRAPTWDFTESDQRKGEQCFTFVFFEDAFVLTKEKRGGKVKQYFVEGP